MYFLEPQLRDVFVEGQFDSRFVKSLLTENAIDGVGVRVIDEVEISTKDLRDCGLTEGQRQRVMHLAAALCKELEQSQSKVSCVIDRDFSLTLSNPMRNSHLLITDFASLCLYSLCDKSLRSFAREALRIASSDQFECFQRDLYGVLELCYFLRATNEFLRLNMRWIRLEKHLTIKLPTVTFDTDGFVRSYLDENGCREHHAEFNEAFGQLLALRHDEPRMMIVEDDLWYILAKCAHTRTKQQGKTLDTPERVKIALLMCTNWHAMASNLMIRELLYRMKTD